MSYDLQVIAKKMPRAIDLVAFLRIAEVALDVTGTFRKRGFVAVRDPAGVTLEIDGPNRIEGEDLPDAAIGAIGRSGWLVELSLKPSSPVTWPEALATHLARVADGVVYDPQRDVVTWPVGWHPRGSQTGAETIDQMGLTWCFRRPMDLGLLARQIVDLLANRCPEALPRRYGDYEPLQHRFEGEQAVDDFVALWIAAAEESIGMLFWSATRPCFDGSASISSLRKYPPDNRQAWARLTLTFDGRPFARDPVFTERIVRFFTDLASLGAIYAAAWLDRGIEYRRGRPTGTVMTETGPMPRADVWVGLPPSPTWLAWFGRPYVDAVRQAVAAHITSESGSGIFLRLGVDPKNADQLAADFPALPPRLLARRRGQPGVWLPGARYSLVSGAPSHAAEEIPPLGDDLPAQVERHRTWR